MPHTAYQDTQNIIRLLFKPFEKHIIKWTPCRFFFSIKLLLKFQMITFCLAMKPRIEKITVAEKKEVKVLTQHTTIASLKHKMDKEDVLEEHTIWCK